MTEPVISRYPQVAGNPLAMAMLCQALKAKGRNGDAHALGMAAIAAAPEDMEVRDLVRGMLSAGVPAWHGPMLHDGPRNRAYAAAIARRVKPGMRVLEIGTGAGLLSLLAARAGAEVVTCEADPMVAASAAENIRRNGYADRIRIVNKYSTDLVLGEDLPEPADLLVSELFDDILFGDGIVDVLADARARLLKPDAPMIPPRCALRLALVALPRPAEQPVGMVEGFDLSAINLLAPAPYTRLRARALGAEQRSDAASALAMDFDREMPFGLTRETQNLVSRGGRIDGVAQWLHVDFGEGVTYENNPFAAGGHSHWGSPVYPLVSPIETAPGDAIAVTARLVSAQLVIRAEPA